MTKVVKDGVVTSTTNKFNSYMGGDSKNDISNQGTNQTGKNLFHDNYANKKVSNSTLQNSIPAQINKSVSFLNNSGNFMSNYLSDLFQYFQENQLNLNNFGDFFTFYNNNFLKNENSKITYSFLLVKGSKSISISRDPILSFDINLVSKL